MPDTHLPSLSIDLAVLVIIVGFDIVAPRFLGALLAVIGMIAASAAFHWQDRGIGVVGALPSGLPRDRLARRGLDRYHRGSPHRLFLLHCHPGSEPAASRAYALRHRDSLGRDVDLVGLSLANAAAGCSSTFVVNGSPIKTGMVDTAGGRGQWSHITTATLVLLVPLFGPNR